MSSHVTNDGGGSRWYQHLTIDLIADAFTRSLLNPSIAWMLPLCTRALGAPYESREFIISVVYASFITITFVLNTMSRRIANGLPREIDWEEEVVVITGGAGGLGKTLAEIFGMRGANVAVLDMRKIELASESLANVEFYECDVGDIKSIQVAKERIEKDLGAPTILINNAGIVNGKPIWELSETDVKTNFAVNLLAHFHTIRTFLPGMFKSETGGTIVTISSVLGKLGASHLSDYTAAKAGLNAMHASLRAELSSSSAPEGAENIRMILATPGQLSTALFAGVVTPSNFLGPVVESVQLAKEIVRMVSAGESGEISLPLYARWIEWMHVLPIGLQKIVRAVSGLDRAMERSQRIRTKKE